MSIKIRIPPKVIGLSDKYPYAQEIYICACGTENPTRYSLIGHIFHIHSDWWEKIVSRRPLWLEYKPKALKEQHEHVV